MKIQEFAESFKKAIYETPAMVQSMAPQAPPMGGNMEPESVPEIHSDEEMNTCTFECELLRQILEHCGCNSEVADNIVQQAKLLGKSVGTLTVDHFDDLVGAAGEELPIGSPQIGGGATVMAAPMVTSQKYNESIKDETNEKFEVVETADEDDENEEVEEK